MPALILNKASQRVLGRSGRNESTLIGEYDCLDAISEAVGLPV